MGRKRTAEDYHRTAEENGWVPGAHEEEDSVQQTKDEPSNRYKQNQQEALDQWIVWVLDSGDWLTVLLSTGIHYPCQAARRKGKW